MYQKINHFIMLKHENPVTMWAPQAARDTFKQVAQASGRPQHEVISEAAELMRKRQERQAKAQQGKKP